MFFLSHYFSYNAGVLSIPEHNPEHVAFKKKNILYRIV